MPNIRTLKYKIAFCIEFDNCKHILRLKSLNVFYY